MLVKFGIAITLLTSLALVTLAQLVPGEPPVEVRVPVLPAPAHVNGHTVLAYELHVTNFLPKEISLNRIEVFGADPGSDPLTSYEDGIVTTMKHGIPENVPLSPARATPITADTIGGNYVTLD